MFFQNLPPVVRGILIAFGVTFVLSIILPSIALSVLPLFPQFVTHDFHFWRLITYPFYFITPGGNLIGNLFRIVWIGMLLVFFGGELETIVHSKRFGTAIGVTVIIGGLIFCILSPEGVLMGPNIITMFILAGFSYLWPTREISLFGFFTVKAWIISVVIFALTIIPMQGFSMDTSASNIFAPIFGALAALLYFHITYQQYSFGRAFLNRLTPTPGQKKKAAMDASDPRAIQRRIDTILDKISTNGMNSLSKEEREFLLKNSKN